MSGSPNVGLGEDPMVLELLLPPPPPPPRLDEGGRRLGLLLRSSLDAPIPRRPTASKMKVPARLLVMVTVPSRLVWNM